MKKASRLLFAVCLGLALDRLFDRLPGTAAAVGQGGGVAKCVSKNGDVNADGTVDVSDAVTILGYLFLGSPTELVPLCSLPGPCELPATGHTKCYGPDGKVNVIPCGGTTCPGQDGFYQTGCPSAGRFVDNQDGTVTDTCTGLMWQKDTADVNGDGVNNGADALPWCNALAYCEGLTFAGHSDWRLPNVRELQSIVDYERFNPTIAPVFGAMSEFYWSSSTMVVSHSYAWCVFFSDGGVYYYVATPGGCLSGNKECPLYVRAVRSDP